MVIIMMFYMNKSIEFSFDIDVTDSSCSGFIRIFSEINITKGMPQPRDYWGVWGPTWGTLVSHLQ